MDRSVSTRGLRSMVGNRWAQGALALTLIATLAVGAVLITHGAHASGATFHVNAATGVDSGTCGPVATPCKTIGQAITNAANGDTISVAAGTYSENLSLNKNLTITGAGIGSTVLQAPVPTSGTGIAFASGASGLNAVTISGLTITGYQYGITMFNGAVNGPLSNITFQNISTSANAKYGTYISLTNSQTIDHFKMDGVTASSNGGTVGRGIWMETGVRTNITIENSTFANNGLVGIDLGDGSVSGLTILNNTVTDNGDSGIGVLGAEGPGANLITGNTVTNNGRFGIELKDSAGNGATSGAGSLVISNNVVTRTVAATSPKDYAGITVIRRLPNVDPTFPTINPDQPSGVAVINNTVRGFVRETSGSTGDGFGIVVGGTGHVIQGNVVTGNNVGIQVQGGNPTLNAQSSDYFDRDNATNGSATITGNLVASNTTAGVRSVTLSSNTSPVITAHQNCIYGNTNFGGKNDLASGAPIYDAASNWWGAVSGPLNATSNPSGTGNAVSDNIGFLPFLATAAAICSPVTSLAVGQPSAISGGATDVSTTTPITLSSLVAPATASTIAHVYYRFFLQASTPPGFTSVAGHTASFMLSGANGTYTVQDYAVDAAGNVEATHSTTLVLTTLVPG
ncbi:MAG TPA: right-handed parallel beta-helix repeat-containing protein, partial [Ktedonobacterales bacterium]|nr:right-handed parallel beta-helix repeat-containing protein [Ktedonobacterales bacterium]